jgi:GDP-4-dehydro-6-deoxy-D-mannose reductase
MAPGNQVLVTGAAGFGGSHLVEHLLERGYGVVALDHPEARRDHLGSVRERVEYVACDLAAGGPEDVGGALGVRGFDAVYHLAGLASVRRSLGDIRRTLQVNAFASLNLLGALVRQGTPPRLLLVGSAEEYGAAAAGAGPVREEAPLAPMNPYALSKVWQEALGGYYVRTERWPIFMSRTYNHTGPRQAPDFVCADFARQIARIERRLAEPVIRVGNLAAARDFLDVRDVVGAYRLIVEQGVPGAVYNVCSGRVWTIAELLQVLLRHAAVEITVEVDVSRHRPLDVPVLHGDPGRLTRDTGWGPAIDIDRTLADLLEYWRGRVAAESGTGRAAGGAPPA